MRASPILTLLSVLWVLEAGAQQPAAPPATGLGPVDFHNSCRPETHADFNRGVSLLHSFWYEEALRAFQKVLAADPGCAMAYWGEAMTGFPQVNGWPETAAVAAAERFLAAAGQAPERTPREAAWIAALRVFYDGYAREHARAQAERYADAMGVLARKYPGDLEAQVFHALALLAADSPDDLALVNPRQAYAILAPLFETHPDHPGIAHYLIHACDNPTMARLALPAARRYGDLAPDSPHALHMPGHIFARLGLWQDDIRSNLASKAAAERLAPLRVDAGQAGAMPMGAENRLHAMEFLEYAYLQTGQDEKARAIVSEARSVRAAEVDPRYPSYYGVVEARFPALYAIETHDWAMAGHLASVADGNAQSQALTLLAQVTAATYLHDAGAADTALHALEELAQKDPPPPAGSLRESIKAQIRAWAALAHGDLEGAKGLMSPVVASQARLGKGEVELPAGEMLADMLLLSGRPGEALRAYRRSLRSDPNRFNALLGAGAAAEQAGELPLAGRYYRAVLANCPEASGAARQQLAHAAAIIGAQRRGRP
jgi:tetratricopeptide (TPR) repeat protein